MTTDSLPAGGDPHRLLADARDLAHRVRLAQRVTWLPLLVLALVTFGAILVYRFAPPILSDCQALDGGGQVCKAWYRTAQFYWWASLTLAYAVIAVGHLRVARARGLGARVLPYVLTGIGLVLLSASLTGTWLALDHPYFPGELPTAVNLLFRLLDPTGVIGLALLVLAWLERRAALLAFALVYLTVVLVPINFGWGDGWGDRWGMAPQLVINGSVLLLGAAAFAFVPRLRQSR